MITAPYRSCARQEVVATVKLGKRPRGIHASPTVRRFTSHWVVPHLHHRALMKKLASGQAPRTRHPPITPQRLPIQYSPTWSVSS